MGGAVVLTTVAGVADAGWIGTALGLLVVAAASGWGHRAWRWLGRPTDGLAAVATGLGTLSMTVIALGWCGLALPVIGWLVLAGIAGGIRGPAGSFRVELGERWKESPVMAGLAGLLVLGALAGAHSPPLIYDAVAYHLLLPQQYALAHKVVAMPHFMPSAFPFLATGGTLEAFLLGGGWRAAGVLAWVWLPIGVLAAARLAVALGGGGTAAALGLGLVPLAPIVSSYPLADMAGTALALLAVATAAAGGRRRWPAAGLLAGLAALTKYNAGAVALAGCAALLPFDRIGMRSAMAMLIGSGLPLLPLLSSNLYSFGAPFFPLLSSTPQAHLVSEWNRAIATAPRTIAGAVIWPARMAWDGSAFIRKELVQAGGGLAGLYLVGTVTRSGPALRLGIAAWAVWLAGYFGHWPLRYLLPVMGLGVALAASVAARVRGGAGALAVVLFVCGARDLGGWARGVAGWWTAGVDADRWIGASRWPSAPGPVSRFLRELPATSVIAPVFEAQLFWAGRRVRPGLMHDRPVVLAEAAAASSDADFLRRLRRRGVTHVLLALNLDPVAAPQWLAWAGPRDRARLEALVADPARVRYADGTHLVVDPGLTGRAPLR